MVELVIPVITVVPASFFPRVDPPRHTDGVQDRSAAFPIVAVIAAAVLFGTTGTAQELGPDGTTPLGVGTLRILVGSVALWCLARRVPSWRELLAHRGLFALGAIGVAVYQPAFFTGTGRSGVALGTVVALGSGPVFAGVIEWIWLRRPPTSRWVVATCVTIAGGALLVFAGGGGSTPDPVGIAGSLAAGLGYAAYAIAAKLLIDRGVHSTVALAWPFTLGTIVLVPFVVREPLGWALTPGGALMLAHLGILTVGVAYVLYGWGLRTLATSTAVTLTLAEPLTASLAAVAVLGERLGPAGWAGAALVLVGLALVGGVRLRPWRRVRYVEP